MRELRIQVDPHIMAAAREERAASQTTVDVALAHFNPLSRLADFESRFPREIDLFRVSAMHPTEGGEVINPYTGKAAQERFQNIGEHCLAVGHCAERIAGALYKAGYIDQADCDWIVSRAIVHDVLKPFEVMRRDAKKAGLAEEVYSVTAYQRIKPLLESRGVPPDLADYLVNAGKETGHNSLKDFVFADESGYRGVIEGHYAEKIIHLADDMTFTGNPQTGRPVTLFLTPWERMLASQFIEKYPFMWKEGLARRADGSMVPINDISSPGQGLLLIGSYADLQVKVGRGIARELQLLLDPESDLDPDLFIKRLVNEA